MCVYSCVTLVSGQVVRQESPLDDHVLPRTKHWITSAGRLLSVGPCRGVAEVKLVTSVRSLNSRWVAWAFAAAYLAVSAVVGVVLLTMPKTDVTDAGNPTSYISDDTYPKSESTPSPAPAGFQRVHGPAGLETVIPDGWRSAVAGQPGAMRAFDPSDPGRIVGYGGAKAVSADLVATYLAYEESFADRTTGYHRVDLNSATYGGHAAVEWEFVHRDGEGLQRVHALYWLVNGVEYFVFASGLDQQWARMKPVYDAMVANSSP
jgi:hypothetical protein